MATSYVRFKSWPSLPPTTTTTSSTEWNEMKSTPSHKVSHGNGISFLNAKVENGHSTNDRAHNFQSYSIVWQRWWRRRYSAMHVWHDELELCNSENSKMFCHRVASKIQTILDTMKLQKERKAMNIWIVMRDPCIVQLVSPSYSLSNQLSFIQLLHLNWIVHSARQKML